VKSRTPNHFEEMKNNFVGKVSEVIHFHFGASESPMNSLDLLVSKELLVAIKDSTQKNYLIKPTAETMFNPQNF